MMADEIYKISAANSIKNILIFKAVILTPMKIHFLATDGYLQELILKVP